MHAIENRLYRFCRLTGNGMAEVQAYRAEELARLRAQRARSFEIQRREPDRMTREAYEVKDITIKGVYITRAYSYTDSKGWLPSYYASRSRAYRLLAAEELRNEEHAAKEAKKRHMEILISNGIGRNRQTSFNTQARFRYTLKERGKISTKGFKNQKMKISINDGKDTEEIEAMVLGNLAIHKIEKFRGFYYRITHIPTGLAAISRIETQRRAKEIVARIMANGWDLLWASENRKDPKARKIIRMIRYMSQT